MAGSSPLARGLRHPNHLKLVIIRIIPARAGFTVPESPHDPLNKDHPRSRGVYQYGRQHHEMGDGSSPLARGLRVKECAAKDILRIIPARAGFTVAPPHDGGGCGDHPRSRGVYRFTVRVPRTGAGSSPLARGLPHLGIGGRCGRGIIPARAGFTVCGSAYGGHVGDHPRSRGVYLSAFADGRISWGSSPLARGLPTRPARKHG